MLNENIRAMRKAKGLSQEELAIRLNVVRQTVSKWEKALSVPDAGMLIRIADALGTSVNVLLGETVAEAEETPLQELAMKLEQLNEGLARQAEQRRKRWRIAFMALGVLAAAGLIRMALGLCQAFRFSRELAASAAIGGADAATGIYVSSIGLDTLRGLLTVLAALAAGIGIHRTGKK